MSVLKNKRRTSKIEYEKNFLGFYEYMMNLIDHIPKRWQRPLGAPMKEALNQFIEKAKRRWGAENVYALKFDFKSFFASIPHAQCYRVLDELYDVMYGGYRLTRRYWKQNTRLHRKRKVVRI